MPTLTPAIEPTLQTIAERESLLLAPFAMHSVDSRGRRFEEPVDPYRGPFQRDRDRIVHSAAWRRLSGKMQVFTGDMGDYHRTRLTHTYEVASIARTLGRPCRLNEDLIEALALFHDLGHPPFGHAGEDALNECLNEYGGFSHNQHALTIAENLEVSNRPFPGLNLTHEVLDGQRTRIDKKAAHDGRLLEVRVVDASDNIAYNSHDTDDAWKLGLVTVDELSEIQLVREAVAVVRKMWTAPTDRELRKAVVHQLIHCQVTDILRVVGSRLAEVDPRDAKTARRAEIDISPGAELVEKTAELERFLYDRVYRHPRLIEIREDAQDRLRAIFNGLLQRRDLLPEPFAGRADTIGPEVAVGEYIACMTDRFCDQTFRDHFRSDCPR